MSDIAATTAVLDKRGMADLLRRAGVAHGPDSVADVCLIDAKVGRRATYAVTLHDHRTVIFVKSYSAAEKATVAAQAIHSLSHFMNAAAPNRVVSLLGRTEQVVVLGAAPGVRLDELNQTASSALVGQLAAGWLADLHAVPAVLERTLDFDSERQTLATWVETLAPRLGNAAMQIIDRFDPVGSYGSGPMVPIHKDFHYGHLFVTDDGSVCAIDFDEARMGPAAFDVAHFCINLEMLGVVTNQAWPTLASQQFVDDYSQRTGWQAGADYARWRLYCVVKLLWQVAQGAGPPGIAAAQANLTDGSALLQAALGLGGVQVVSS